MKIELDRHSGVTLTEQIRQFISERITSGQLAKGSRLPSVRELADSLQVSLVTVVHAYDALQKDGLIVRVHGKGTFVAGNSPSAAGAACRDQMPHPVLDWQLAVTDYLPPSTFWRQRYAASSGRETELSASAIDHRLLPLSEVAEEFARWLLLHPETLGEYAPVQGDPQLREAIADYLQQLRVSVSPQQLLITSGIQQGLELVARTFVGPGDTVAMETPTYTGAIDVFRGRGAAILPVPVDGEGMRTDMLAALADQHRPKIIYTIPAFHNPTGVAMSPQRRRELLDVAEQYNCLIVEDDPWSELFFVELQPPLASEDRSGSVVYLKGFSKILSPSCRIAALVAHGSILRRLIGSKMTADMGSPLLPQKALLSFLAAGRMTGHLDRLRSSLRLRRDAVLRLLESCSPPGVRWTAPDGGLHLWMTLPAWINSDRLLADAQANGIAFLPGSVCYPTEPEWNHLRISFSRLDTDRLRELIPLLCELLSREMDRYPLNGHDDRIP